VFSALYFKDILFDGISVSQMTTGIFHLS